EWKDYLETSLAVWIEENLLAFDATTWNRNKIIEALTSPEVLKEFIIYKLNTLPNQTYIPEAIKAKLYHRDTAFFRTFTRALANRSQHQVEFNSLFNKAL